MAKSPQEFLISWLKDAHAMEQGVAQILENHIQDAEGQPQMASRLQQHLETTRRHADHVQSCIERLGDSTSAIKSGVGNLVGMMQGLTTGAAEDDVVKNVIADFAVEHFEIASYRSLIAAAEAVGDQETARICQDILRDEEQMASWFAQQLPNTTQQFLTRTGAGQQGR